MVVPAPPLDPPHAAPPSTVASTTHRERFSKVIAHETLRLPCQAKARRELANGG